MTLEYNVSVVKIFTHENIIHIELKTSLCIIRQNLLCYI